MGIDLIALRALALGRRLGFLNFAETVTLGRHEIHFFGFQYDTLVARGVLPKAKFPADAFAEPLLNTLGASLVESVDRSDYEGASIIHDFNDPLIEQCVEKFTLFLDFGSIEHIFDVRQSLMNINALLKPDGSAMILTNGNGWMTHGFYQFSPEFFYSTLSDRNGFAETRVVLIDYDRPRYWHYIRPPSVIGARNLVPYNRKFYILCITKKVHSVPVIHALQSDYELGSWQQKEHRHFTPHHGLRSLALRLSPRLYQAARPLYRRMAERRGFERQVATFDPERISPREFYAISSQRAAG
jgi:hypothetical protein